MTQSRASFALAMLVAVSIAAASSVPALAYEFGFPGWFQKPGLTIGVTAATPPPGLYMFNEAAASSASLVGPGAISGQQTRVQVASDAVGFTWVPGWSFFGATYDASLLQPFLMVDIGPPFNVQVTGMHNTYLVPAELTWKLGDSGLFIKTGLGIGTPDGSISGPAGLNNVGDPWWTFQPELLISYLKNGWNFTANLFGEINTANPRTAYRSGDVLHLDLTATKAIGKWTIGPVAYYAAQITNDKSSAFYNFAINANRYELWAVGGLVGYDFGPATFTVWALDDVVARAAGGTQFVPGVDSATIPKGFSIFATLNFRLGDTDAAPAVTRPLIHK